MNPLTLLLGGALLVGILAGSSSETVKISNSGWNDEVGSSHSNAVNDQIKKFNSFTNECKSALAKVEKLKPIEFKSKADEINSVLSEFNSAINGNF